MFFPGLRSALGAKFLRFPVATLVLLVAQIILVLRPLPKISVVGLC